MDAAASRESKPSISRATPRMTGARNISQLGAALVDGAARWTTFVRNMLPLSKPALVVTALFPFMNAWNEFILAATVLGKETLYTLPVQLQRYVGQYSAQWGSFAAMAILVSLPVMALFFVLQKHLVGGLTAGGVKG